MSNQITPLTQTSNTLDTLAKYVRVMEKTGVSYDQLITLPINDRRARQNLAEFLKAGCPKVQTNGTASEPETGYTLARTILGKDLISPEEISDARPGVVYETDAQFAEFEHTLPLREELEWLRDNGFMLVAGPPKPMSLLEIRDLKDKYLFSKTEGWYANDYEKFSRTDKATPKWLKLRKGPVSDSTHKSWDQQVVLVPPTEEVPNAAEVVWGVTTYKAVRSIYLLSNIEVRTFSRDSGGNRVSVGDFVNMGLSVNNGYDSKPYSNIGVASSRK